MTRRARAWTFTLCVFLAVVGALAFVPLPASDLESHARPIHEYATAVAAAEARTRADDQVTAPGGSSIVLLHGHRTRRVVVLLHGFTNSPTQFAELARQLYGAGDNVYVPRLPHHGERGSDVASLAIMTAEELRDAADSAVDLATGLGDSVIVVGLSAGGTMASWIAQNRCDVVRVVIAAPVVQLAKVPPWLNRPMMNLGVRLPNVNHHDPVDAAAPDREEGWTSRAVAQILRLGAAVARSAAQSPPGARDVRLVLNAHEHTISADAALGLAHAWAARGATVSVYEIADSLGLPHDIIDPRQRVHRLDVVYPAIVALAHGEVPAEARGINGDRVSSQRSGQPSGER
jgi:esterase/lipase